MLRYLSIKDYNSTIYTKIRFRCFGVLEKSVQDLGRKRRKKPHRGQKWVGKDERVSLDV